MLVWAFNRSTKLQPHQLERSLVTMGDATRLRLRLRKGQPTTIAAIGASNAATGRRHVGPDHAAAGTNDAASRRAANGESDAAGAKHAATGCAAHDRNADGVAAASTIATAVSTTP